MRFDPQALAELVDLRSQTATQLDEVAVRLNDMQESDTPWDEPRQRQYERLSMDHVRIETTLTRVTSDLREMQRRAPRRSTSAEQPALNRWVTRGHNGLTAEEQAEHLRPMDTEMEDALPQGATPSDVFRIRAQTRSDIDTGTGAAGLAVEEQWDPEVIENLAFFGDVQRAATSFVTETGGDYTINGLDGTAQKGVLVTDQTAAIGNVDGANARDLPEVAFPPVKAVTFKAWLMHSGPMRIRREAMRDVHFNLQMRLDMAVMQRFGRGWLDYLTNGGRAPYGTPGAGTDSPYGIVTSAKAGPTAASNSALTYEELLALEYAIDRAYRVGNEGGLGGFTGRNAGMNGWMLSDSAERIIRSMKDNDGRPLWTPGITAGAFGLVDGAPQRILGYLYQVNNAMDAYAGDSAIRNPIIFGNFNYYGVRTVGVMDVYRFWDSRTAQANSFEVLGFSYMDGRPMGAITAGATTCDAYAKLLIPSM